MKNLISLLVFVITSGLITAQENFEVSTLRIGPYKIFMEKSEAEKLAGTQLQVTGGDQKNIIKYNGESIFVELYEGYINESKPNTPSIMGLVTNSRKFKTKSGIGIGNTKDDLINSYRNYPSFSVHPAWDDKAEKRLKDTGYFTLNDDEAGTQLIFKFVNNIITEISVYINQGC